MMDENQTGGLPEYAKLRRKLKGAGTRVFKCGCIQKEDEDVFMMPNGSARCNEHRWARVDAVRVICARCGETADLDVHAVRGKYCPECAQILYPRGGKRKVRTEPQDEFTRDDVEYLKAHYTWETAAEMSEAIGIGTPKVTAKCRELKLKLLHPWTHKKERALEKFFASIQSCIYM